MRGRIFISVLLGISLMAPSAFATRVHRERMAQDRLAREHPGRPESPGHAMERSRGGDMDSMSSTRAQSIIDRAARTRAPGSGFAKVNNARGQKLLGRGAAAARTSFNKAGEDQGMSKAAAQMVIFKVAHSRATGSGLGKINNARGKSMLGPAASSEKTSFNAAGESNGISKAGAQAVIFKAAHSRAPFGGRFGKVNNAMGKSMVGNRTKSMRSACDETDVCSMGKAGAQAVIFKAAHSRGPGK